MREHQSALNNGCHIVRRNSLAMFVHVDDGVIDLFTGKANIQKVSFSIGHLLYFHPLFWQVSVLWKWMFTYIMHVYYAKQSWTCFNNYQLSPTVSKYMDEFKWSFFKLNVNLLLAITWFVSYVSLLYGFTGLVGVSKIISVSWPNSVDNNYPL